MGLDYTGMSGVTGLGSGLGSQERPRPDLSILTDPALVEDYDEILKQLPTVKKDDEIQSVNASVVITPTEAQATAIDYKKSKDKEFPDLNQLTLNDKHNGLTPVADEEHDESFSSRHGNDLQDSDYAYSDSDFEDNLEERLRSLETTSDRNGRDEVPSLEAEHDDGTLDSSDRDERGEATVSKSNVQAYVSEQEEEEDDEDEDEEDDMKIGWNEDRSDDCDDFQPLNPPQELDPSKLYALYPFQGPDPSHCQLEQDEGCTLLNDQDSYWWLVKRCRDGKIGFAPAELLETFPERLARLNCWKNENISSQSIPDINDRNSNSNSSPSSSSPKGNDIESTESPLQSYTKTNKSVSFNNVVSYAERFVDAFEVDPLEEDGGEFNDIGGVTHASETGEEGETSQTDGTGYESALTTHLKQTHEIHETHLNDDMQDDVSEVVSDATFNVHEMAPLMIQKNRTSTTSSKGPVEKSNDLRQVFQAPIMPIASSRGNSQMTSSNSNCSISTIGEYSPSSSDWTNDSPQLPSDNEFQESKANDQIPSSRAIQDISKIVGSYDTTDTQSAHSEDTQRDMDSLVKLTHKSQNSISTLNDLNINDSVETEGPVLETQKECSMTPEDTNNYSAIPSSTSSTCMDHEQISPSISDVNLYSSSTALGEIHPVINTLYNPIFTKIDDMMEKIEKAISH
ncbi:unnamed protein product [Kluyveromyces dobzhanskii CBS 2104]|uniref:WGS project CCBQ000000000 data, contig MAT n=1 Tax=Kluyveromyces dobzhanskii CBS 2104 TaxID=1427455 RepID=A0A0A8L1V3_9SACH|nr:unnamed protein product [Kluyveromyces dobzhanskii CBS 2104]